MLSEYKNPTTIPTDATGKKNYESNSNAVYAIIGGLVGLNLLR